MAKSTVHIDKLGAFDSFKAPWESEAGADAEVDKPVLKKLVYNLKKDLAAARDNGEDAKAALAEAETKVTEAQAAASDGSGAEAQKQIDKLTKERDDFKAKVEKFESDQALADLRAEVLGDFATANPKAAKYVTGETKEELEASLEEVKADWGISDEPDDDDDDDEDEEDEDDLEKVVRTTPKTRSLLNPADKANGKAGEAEVDYSQVADTILSGNRLFG